MTESKTTPDWSKWTDAMIANHFGQNLSKNEIEKVIGRIINWDAIEKGHKYGYHN